MEVELVPFRFYFSNKRSYEVKGCAGSNVRVFVGANQTFQWPLRCKLNVNFAYMTTPSESAFVWEAFSSVGLLHISLLPQ